MGNNCLNSEICDFEIQFEERQTLYPEDEYQLRIYNSPKKLRESPKIFDKFDVHYPIKNKLRKKLNFKSCDTNANPKTLKRIGEIRELMLQNRNKDIFILELLEIFEKKTWKLYRCTNKVLTGMYGIAFDDLVDGKIVIHSENMKILQKVLNVSLDEKKLYEALESEEIVLTEEQWKQVALVIFNDYYQRASEIFESVFYELDLPTQVALTLAVYKSGKKSQLLMNFAKNLKEMRNDKSMFINGLMNLHPFDNPRSLLQAFLADSKMITVEYKDGELYNYEGETLIGPKQVSPTENIVSPSPSNPKKIDNLVNPGNEEFVLQFLSKMERRARKMKEWQSITIDKEKAKLKIDIIFQNVLQINELVDKLLDQKIHKQKFLMKDLEQILQKKNKNLNDLFFFKKNIPLQKFLSLDEHLSLEKKLATITKICVLDFSKSLFDDQKCEILRNYCSDNPEFSYSINKLCFFDNLITEKGAKFLSEMNLMQLKCFNICFNDIHEEGLCRLAEANWTNLETLHVNCVEMTGKGFQALSNSVYTSNLQHLDLGFNYTEKNNGECCKSLETFKQGKFLSLKVLNLENNNLGSQEIKTLLDTPLPEKLELLKIGFDKKKISKKDALKYLISKTWQNLKKITTSSKNNSLQTTAIQKDYLQKIGIDLFKIPKYDDDDD